MKPLACGPAFLVPALLAQAPKVEIIPMVRKEPSLTGMEKGLKGTRGRLLIRSAGDRTFADGLQALLKRAPLDEMDLPAEALIPGSRLDQEVAQRLGLEPGPCWMLVDGDFRLLAQGRSVPDRPEVLAADLQAAGWKTRLETLNAFLQRHPDHLEAQGQRLSELEQHVFNRLRPLLAEGSRDRLKRPLTEEEDARIFGAYAKALETFLQDPAFVAASNVYTFMPPAAKASSVMAATARRLLPRLEASLRRANHHNDHARWSLWAGLVDLVPEVDPLAFVASLPTMDLRSLHMQPSLLPRLHAAARRTGRWERFLPLVLRCWESISSPNMGRSSLPDFSWEWEGAPGLAVEALVELQRDAEATDLVQQFLDWSGQRAAAGWAAKLARDCQRPDLAKVWGALQPGAEAGVLFAGLRELGNVPPGMGVRTSWTSPPQEKQTLRRVLRQEGLTLMHLEPPAWKGGPAPDSDGSARVAWQEAWGEVHRQWHRRSVEVWPVSVDWDGKAGQEILAREGWEPRRRWVLLDRQARVLETGLAVPSAADLEARMRRHGFLPEQERAEVLLKEYPEYVEALKALLDHHQQRAEYLQQALNEREVALRSNQARSTPQSPAAREAAVEAFLSWLPEDVRTEMGPGALDRLRAQIRKDFDARVPIPEPVEGDPEDAWGEAAKVLDRLLEIPEWVCDAASDARLRSEAGASPAFQRAAPDFVGRVEALLRRAPSNTRLWKMWCSLIAMTQTSPEALLASIVRSPGQTSDNEAWIQDMVVQALVAQKRWQAVADRASQQWEAWKDQPEFYRGPYFSGFKAVLQAELMLQHEDRAQSWLDKQLGAVESEMASIVLWEAAQAAQAAGRKDLAAAWVKRAEAARKTPDRRLP